MSKLTIDQVKHVAKLANLTLTDQEVKKYSEQLSKILDYIDQINSVNISNVEPTFNVSGNETITQADKVSPSLTQEEALSNASKKQENLFVTRGVFNNE